MPKKKKKGNDGSKVFKGEILTEDQLAHTKKSMIPRRTERMIRYWCFAFEKEVLEGTPVIGAPKGLRKFVESLDGFMGWENFAKTWDIVGTNPFKIIARLESVWDKWDQVMVRVAIPLGASEAEVKARTELLAKEYQRKGAVADKHLERERKKMRQED